MVNLDVLPTVADLLAELEACRANVSDLKRTQRDPRLTKYDKIELLHPKCRDSFHRLNLWLRQTNKPFHIFETWRSPIRQQYLFDLPEPVTRAKAWESDHQYGFAADFVAKDAHGHWSWDERFDWSILKRVAPQFGLEAPITWDPGHVRWPKGGQILREMDLI